MATAKAFLIQAELLNTRIDNKLEELARLRALATRITSTLRQDVVQNSGTSDKVGNCVAKIVTLEAEITGAVDDLINQKRVIISVIDKVTNPDELAVLSKRYLSFRSLEQIAVEMGFTYRNICYIHGRALQTVNNLLKGDGNP